MAAMILGTRDHPPGCKDFIIIEVFKYDLKPGKKLEEKQATTAHIREKFPDKIPVVLVQKCYTLQGTQIEEILSLLVGVESSKRQFFNQVANLMCPTKDLGEFKCWNLDFKTPMSSYYDVYKDNDGILYLKFSCEEGLPKYLPTEEDNNPKREISRYVAKHIHDFERITLDLVEMVERNSNDDDQSEEEEDGRPSRQTIAKRFHDIKKTYLDLLEKRWVPDDDCDDDWVLI